MKKYVGERVDDVDALLFDEMLRFIFNEDPTREGVESREPKTDALLSVEAQSAFCAIEAEEVGNLGHPANDGIDDDEEYDVEWKDES